jgi:hypothetical protein
MFHQRLENDRPGGANRFDRRFTAGGLKNAISLPSTGCDLPSWTVTRRSCDREAGDDAIGQCLADAFLDRGHEHPRNDAALDDIDEFEAGATFQRFDAQRHFTKLTGTTALLLVPAVPFGGRSNRFTIGDLRRCGIEFEFVLLRQPGELGAQVHFADAANDRFIGRRMAFDA